MFKITGGCVKLIEEFEGCEKKGADGLIYPYIDAVGIWTIGIGTTVLPDGTKVTPDTPPITYDTAVAYCLRHLKGVEDSINRLVTANINQNQVNSIATFIYNIGDGGFASSTALRRINANPFDTTIREAWCRWVNGTDPTTGQLIRLEGLVRRRNAECDLYFKPV